MSASVIRCGFAVSWPAAGRRPPLRPSARSDQPRHIFVTGPQTVQSASGMPHGIPSAIIGRGYQKQFRLEPRAEMVVRYDRVQCGHLRRAMPASWAMARSQLRGSRCSTTPASARRPFLRSTIRRGPRGDGMSPLPSWLRVCSAARIVKPRLRRGDTHRVLKFLIRRSIER